MNTLFTNSLRVAALFVLTTTVAYAETTGGAAASWGPVGAGLGIGLAVLGGALGQGKTASSALEGMARNPQAGNLLVPMIIGLALIESLVLLGFLVTNGMVKG